MELVFMSAAELAAAVRDGSASAVEVLEAHLAQIESHSSALNAVVTLDADRALARAREADAARARGISWGPLHGVPFTLKDALATAGVRTTTGSPALDHVPQQDSSAAARLRAAGGVLMGKTNVAAMLGDPAQSANPVFGRTSNPWDIGRTPGGSSGGAAAAVAAGLSPLDVGTDLAGSIRIPAHFCGVCGLKPTEHRVSLDGLIPGLPPPRSVRLMSCAGPIARTPEDLALILQIIAGPDGRDTDVPPVPLGELEDLTLAGLRVAVAPTFPGVPVARAVRAAVQDLAGRLAQAGAAVDEPALPVADIPGALAAAGELIGMMLGAFDPSPGGEPTSLAAYLAALHERDLAIVAWETFFEQWDVLLCPTAMTTAFPHCETGAPIPVDGRDEPYWSVSGHTALFNYTGHPAAVLPAALDGQGLPIGVQLVGRRWGDAGLLAAARAFTRVAGPARRPPGF